MNEREKCPRCGSPDKRTFSALSHNPGQRCSIAFKNYHPWHDAPEAAASDKCPDCHNLPNEPAMSWRSCENSIHRGASVANERPQKRDPAVESADELAKAAFALGKLSGKHEAREGLGDERAADDMALDFIQNNRCGIEVDSPSYRNLVKLLARAALSRGAGSEGTK